MSACAALCRVADGAALTSVLEACAYAGRSLARVGLDLRPLLEPAVTSAVRALLQRNLAHAGALFCSSLESHKWVAMPLAQPKGGEARAPGDPGEALLRRAHGLLSHPPLAVLLNGVRSAVVAAACSAPAVRLSAQRQMYATAGATARQTCGKAALRHGKPDCAGAGSLLTLLSLVRP